MSEAQVASISLVHTAALHLLRAKIVDKPLIGSWDAVLDYCHARTGHSETEIFYVLYLDRKNRLIADEVLARGTVDHVPVYPREVARRALFHNASAILMIHNHPSGDPSPSQTDIEMTKTVQSALETIGVTLHDHVIIGHGRDYSLRAHGDF